MTDRPTPPERLRGRPLEDVPLETRLADRLETLISQGESLISREKTIERLHQRIDDLNNRMWKLLFLAAAGGAGGTRILSELMQ